MTTEHLREFITLAEMGNYAAAAEPLFISEATLSRHIMALEKELGAELFKRFPRRIELTDAGMVFLPFARQMVAAESECHSHINRRIEFGKSSLSIGIDKALAFYGVADLIAGFIKANPSYTVHIVEDSTFALREQVSAGTIQLAFIVNDTAHPDVGLKYKDFKTDFFVAAIAPDHPFAGQRSIHISKIKTEVLLMPPRFSAMHELCVRAFRKAGLEPDSSIYAELSGKTTKELIKSGLCVAVLPSAIADAWHNDGVHTCPLAPTFEMSTSIVYSPKSLSHSVRVFLDYIRGVNTH